MLRTGLILTIFVFGLFHARKSPFNTLLLYLWIANFRPLEWVWEGGIQNIPMSFIAGMLLVFYTFLSPRNFKIHSMHVLMGLFLVQAGLSTYFSLSPEWSHVWYYEFIRIVLVSYIISILVDEVPKLRIAFLIVVFSLGFEGAKQGLVNLVIQPGSINMNSLPQFGDNNGVAVGMLMLLPMIIGLYNTSRHHWEKILLSFTGLGILLRALTTYSRGMIVTLIILGIASVIRGRYKIRYAIIIITVALMTSILFPSQFWNRMETIRAPTTNDLEWNETSGDILSIEGRLHYWKIAWEMAKDRPFLGVGFNGYQRTYDDYDFSDGKYGTQRAAHGTFPSIIADNGFLAGILFLGICLTIFITLRQVRTMALGLPDQEEFIIYSTMLEYSFIAYLVGGTFLSFAYIESIWHIIGFCIGLFLTVRNERTQHIHSENHLMPELMEFVPEKL